MTKAHTGAGYETRRGTEADLAELELLYAEWLSEQSEYRGDWDIHYGFGPEAGTGLLDCLGSPDDSVFVVETGSNVVGCAIARAVAAPGAPDVMVCRVSWLYVKPTSRRTGAGRCLFDALETWGRAEGCSRLDVPVLPGHRESKNFAEHLGLRARSLTMSVTWD